MKKLPLTWETERMIMQEITEADTDFIVELRSDPDVYRYFLAPHPLKRQEHICWYREKYLKDNCQSSYIARLKIENTPVGVFSAKQIDGNKMEISYILSPDARGKGLAAEATIGMERICEKYTDTSVFLAQIHIDNLLSLKFIKRMGYMQKGCAGDFMMYQKDVKKEP